MFARFKFNPRTDLSWTFRSTPAPSLPRFVRSIGSPRLRPKAQRGMRIWNGGGRWVNADSVPDDPSPRSRLLFLRRIRRVVGGFGPLGRLGRGSAVRLGEELPRGG